MKRMKAGKTEEDKMLAIIKRQITQLFQEGERENLTLDEFAIKIWLGTIMERIPEKTLASILFEKAIKVSPEETYQMITDLVSRSKKKEVAAVKRAILLLIEGLQILETDSLLSKESANQLANKSVNKSASNSAKKSMFFQRR